MITMLLFVYALVVSLIVLAVFCELAVGSARLRTLAESDQWTGTEVPLVSVIVPACNEEQSIGETLRSLCRQRYDGLEIIVVNDRSTDRTGHIAAQVSREHRRVRLLTVDSLPAGWLGKANALQVGAQAARGDYLLFTDADVLLEETAVSRAVSAMQADRLDHLAVIFQNCGGGRLLNALITEAGAGILFLFKPWRVRRSGGRYFVGVGAFNMVRATAYRIIGGHTRIRMQTIDDMFLGKLIRRHGLRQDCRFGWGLVTVPWYDSVAAMIGGLMKNGYALFAYRPGLALLGAGVVASMAVVPVWCLAFTDGVTRALFLAAVMIRVAGIGTAMLKTGLPAGSVPMLLVTPYLTVYMILRVVWVTHRAGGVTWRGSFYPLGELRTAEWLLSGLFCRGVQR